MSKQPRASILDHSPVGPLAYVILISKPGQFRTEPGAGMQAVESYDYLFCGRKRAHFVIATLVGEEKIRVIDDADPELVNYVPSKFLDRFETIDLARRELKTLAKFGTMDIELVKL